MTNGKGACEGVDTISMRWNQKTLGTTKSKRIPSKKFFFFLFLFLFFPFLVCVCVCV